MLFKKIFIFGETAKYIQLFYFFVGIVLADVLDSNHPCYCPKWSKRYEPSMGCLNGTRWVIQDCYSRLDNSCYWNYNTMWREECGWSWSNWSKCSKECGEGESTRKRICKKQYCPPENGPVFQRKYCQIQECPVTEMNFIEDPIKFGKSIRFDPSIDIGQSFTGTGSTTVTTTIHLPNPPLWTEWNQWSSCHAGWTTYLGIKKSEIKTSAGCVAGTMSRRKYCNDWEKIYGTMESADMHRELPICKEITYEFEPINSINDTVKIRNEYNAETRLCHVPQCEWSEWGDCQLRGNKRIRKKDCWSQCESVCDPNVSICMAFESEKCDWETNRQAKVQVQRSKMKVYSIMGAVFCFSILLFCACLCKLRKNRQKSTKRDEIGAEKPKISEIEASSSSNSDNESLTEHIIEQPPLI